jgi:hypothetical protein
MTRLLLTRMISLLWIFHSIHAISSPLNPYTTYHYSTPFETNIADLWWTIDEPKKEITFELHVKTTGWIALGISPGKLISSHRPFVSRSFDHLQRVA